MGAHFTPAPPAAITRVLAQFDRTQLAGFVAVAIDLMDLADGDTDLEDNALEDDFLPHGADGPGCPVGDPDGAPWTEFHTRGRHKLTKSGAEPSRRITGGEAHEDDEDDDPAEQDDEPEDGDIDRCDAGDDMMRAGPVVDRGKWLDSASVRFWMARDEEESGIVWTYGVDQDGPVMPEMAAADSLSAKMLTARTLGEHVVGNDA